MPSIFVSYRRSDAPGHAGRLYDQLVARFGRGSVFKDLDSMEPGFDFEEVIKQTIGQCDAVIAVIGRDWLSRGPDEVRRIDSPDDWVRLELATALNRKDLRVIPTLVAGAQMPQASELPDDLRALTRRHAVELTETGWNSQVDRLIESLERALEPSREPEVEDRKPSPAAERRAHRHFVDRRERHGGLAEQVGWTVEVANPSARDRVIKMRYRGSEHVLTVRIGTFFDKIVLDGTRLTRKVGAAGIASSFAEFTLTTPSGEVHGRLLYKVTWMYGPFEWLILDVDAHRIYEEGPVPRGTVAASAP